MSFIWAVSLNEIIERLLMLLHFGHITLSQSKGSTMLFSSTYEHIEQPSLALIPIQIYLFGINIPNACSDLFSINPKYFPVKSKDVVV